MTDALAIRPAAEDADVRHTAGMLCQEGGAVADPEDRRDGQQRVTSRLR